MRLTILSDNLQKRLPFLIHAVSPRPQLPVLGNLLLSTKEHSLTLSATDLEISIEITIPAQIEKTGNVTLPARIFADLINSFPKEKIVLETTDANMHISGKNMKSVLQTGNKEEFPLLYEDFGSNVIQTKTDVLQKMLKYVVFAAGIESTRPALSGVLFTIEEKSMQCVATDGYRLSLITHNHEPRSNRGEPLTMNPDLIGVNSESITTLLIPARVIREVMSFDPSVETAISVSKKNNQVLFKQENTILIGRVIDAQFPPYGKIIPADVSTTTIFDREELLKAVKACAIFAREGSNVVILSLKKEAIIVSAKGASFGENTVEIEGKITGEENEIAFNVRYLIDVLSTIQEERLVFEMTGPLNPGVFKIENDKSFLHLIMPIKV